MNRLNFIKLCLSALFLAQQDKLLASDHSRKKNNLSADASKEVLYLNGKEITVTDNSLDKYSSIIGPGLISLKNKSGIRPKGTTFLIQNVHIKSDLPFDNNISIIKLSSGMKNVTIEKCTFSGKGYSILSADKNSKFDKNLLFKKRVEGLFFSGNTCDGIFSRHLYLHSAQKILIKDNIFKKSLRDSIRLRQNTKEVIIKDNFFYDIGKVSNESSDAIDTFWSGRELIIKNNIINGCAKHGLDIKGISPDSDIETSNIIISGNQISNCQYSGVLLSGGELFRKKSNAIKNIVLSENLIKLCNLNNKNKNDALIFLRHGVQNVQIKGNNLSAQKSHAIVLGNFTDGFDQTKNIIISENIIMLNPTKITDKKQEKSHKKSEILALKSYGTDNLIFSENIINGGKKSSVSLLESYRNYRSRKLIQKNNIYSP